MPSRVAKKPHTYRRRRGPPNDVGLTEVVYSRAGKILLMSLHPEVQRLLHHSFQSASAYILLCEAFPDRLPGLKAKFYMNVIHTAVKKTDPPLPPDLVEHINQHPEWIKEIATLVSLTTAYYVV